MRLFRHRSASTVEITPFDPSTMKDVERGIMNADMNLTPNSDGTVKIYVYVYVCVYVCVYIKYLCVYVY